MVLCTVHFGAVLLLLGRTGALHVGDRILSINQATLQERTLTDAIKMLQNAGHTVTLKISRPASTTRQGQISRPAFATWQGQTALDKAVNS